LALSSAWSILQLMAAYPDIVWRPLTAGDADALYQLHNQFEEEQNLPFRTSREEVVHNMAEPKTNLESDTRVAVAPDGTFLASVWIDLSLRQGPKHRAYVLTTALAGHGALELDAIDWAEARVGERFAAIDDDLPRVIRTFAEAKAVDRIARYESRGYPIVRYFVDMVRPLAEPFPDPALPAGVELLAWSDRWLASSFEAHAEAFADHWGSLPPSWDEWQHRASVPGCRLDLSHVAVVEGEVVAYCMNGIYPQDWEVIGRKDGWIDILGTRRAWRKRGLASALLNASFQSFADEGLDAASIGVDAANPTGALHLYESLGFREEHRAVSLMKEVSPSG